MAQVTGGLVSIEDGLKKAEEYAPPRKVRVELSFAVAEGEDFQATFDMVSAAANTRVAALLNGTALNVVQATAAPQTEATQTRVRRTKAQIAADLAAAGTKDPAAVEEDPTGGQESVIHLPDATEDPAGMGEFDVPATGGDASGMEEFDVPASEEPVTDADLNSAVQKKNGELAAPHLIRELIGSYNPDPTKPFQLRQIPADARREFLNKLGALKKPAA